LCNNYKRLDSNKSLKIAVVGVTGMVGQELLAELESSGLPDIQLIPVASARSIGQEVLFKGKKHLVVTVKDALALRPDIAIFSAGGQTSLEYAPAFADAGTTVIDNSSAWRMDPNKKLIVPEINAQLLTNEDKIIANPNCSTIQMVMVLAPLHREYGIERVIISTYQSYTGTGMKAVRQFEAEKEDQKLAIDERAYLHPIYNNVIPQCDVFLDNDYTKEEMKLVHETHKILGDENIKVSATAVRVPTNGGHSESVNIQCKQSFQIDRVRELLSSTPGVVVLDDPAKSLYPMPVQSRHKREVFVGRIRQDISCANGINLWIVADNLRKGAATNAVQIAEYIVAQQLL
jgi:aspartate-semialdehyde dehydrogenase